MGLVWGHHHLVQRLDYLSSEKIIVGFLFPSRSQWTPPTLKSLEVRIPIKVALGLPPPALSPEEADLLWERRALGGSCAGNWPVMCHDSNPTSPQLLRLGPSCLQMTDKTMKVPNITSVSHQRSWLLPGWLRPGLSPWQFPQLTKGVKWLNSCFHRTSLWGSQGEGLPLPSQKDLQRYSKWNKMSIESPPQWHKWLSLR